jgi:hypothetical protein
MKNAMRALVLAGLAAAGAVCAQPAERPNLPVYRSGPWFVVHSGPDGGDAVSCTGFYRAKRRVQLSKDALIIKTSEPITGVAISFDGEAPAAQRPLSPAEKELGSITFTGDDFSRLARSRKVRIAAHTSQGTISEELELEGFEGALKSIKAGCPLPAPPATETPRRGRPHSKH